MAASHFLFASWQPPPAYFFSGYAFKGTDFVFGADGAQQFHAAQGSRIGMGQDGCYAELIRQGSETRIHADFRGNMRLFYYADGGAWAVSNSWLMLAQALGERGIALTLDRGQLAAWFSQNLNFKQLTCYQTVLREIRLLPAFCSLVIDDTGLSLHQAERAAPLSYDDALTRFLGQWQSRCATLLEGLPAPMRADISGGLDSRASLGLLNLGKTTGRIDFGTSGAAHFIRDAEIAALIAQHLGVPLETRRPSVATYPGPAEALIDTWKRASLGQYAPVRFSTARPDITVMRFGGSGGESLRGIYDDDSVADYIETQAKRYGTHMPTDPRPWSEDLTETLARITAEFGDEGDPLLSYFREFRSRLHAGTTARSTISIQPLVGKSAIAASMALDTGKRRNRQILYDMMHNLDPGLLEIPFDEPHKAPSTQNRADLTRVELDKPLPGRIYAATSQPVEKTAARISREQIYAALAGQVAADLPLTTEPLLGKGYLTEALAALHRAQDPDGAMRARDTIPIHNIVLLQELARLTDLSDLDTPVSGIRSWLRRALDL